MAPKTLGLFRMMREKTVSPKRTSQGVSSAGGLSSLWSCDLPWWLGHQSPDRPLACLEPYTGPCLSQLHPSLFPLLSSYTVSFLSSPSFSHHLPSPSAIGKYSLLAGKRPAAHPNSYSLNGFQSQDPKPTPASLAHLPASQLELSGESLFISAPEEQGFCSLL